MCGRFALGIPKPVLEEFVQTPVPEPYEARWNVAPGQDVLAVTAKGLELFRWGFVPHWVNDATKARPMINARSETVFEKPSFRDAAASRRCLLPATHYYEWKGEGAGKVPYAFSLHGANLFFMAGIWSEWADSRTGEVVRTCAILTTRPNSLAAEVHDRMPVILPEQASKEWMEPGLTPDKAAPLFEPVSASTMRCLPANPALGSMAAEGGYLLDPPPVSGRLPGL